VQAYSSSSQPLYIARDYMQNLKSVNDFFIQILGLRVASEQFQNIIF
jgi:hypothetical protein